MPVPFPTYDALRLIYSACPWGIAVIGEDGSVCALNPRFEAEAGLSTDQAAAFSEADLNASLSQLKIEHRRAEINHQGIAAVHFIRRTEETESQMLRVRQIAETIREPLASIYGFTELLLTENYDEDLRQQLTATLLDQIEVLIDIVNTRLDIDGSNSLTVESLQIQAT